MANALSLPSPAMDQENSFRSLEELNEVFPDFEIKGLLGRGGMGAVYEAWQKSLGRKVGLKVLTPELMRSADFLERLQREALVMARLEHPNIARVYDSGVGLNGDAFIVMELVRGEPITTFIKNRNLPLRERLDLFTAICAAVQYAHQKGIIHRDLKPSNILVTEVDGKAVPKVIDFGLAKPLEQREGDDAAWLSAAHFVGTPAYMSPEQISGGEIDSRTDIYSLGRLLHEMLTGEEPSEESALTGAWRDFTRQESSESAALPETQIPRDLEAIVAKATQEDPRERYQTAGALPEEIRRYLSDEPVQAVPATAGYLAKKFCRRHRIGLAIGGAFLLMLLTAFGLVVRESIRTRRAEQLAEEHLRQGEDLIEFLVGELHYKLQTVGRLDILESTVNHVESFYRNATLTGYRPEGLYHRGRAMVQLGMIRMAQGKQELAQKNYGEAIGLYERALKAQPRNVRWVEELGQAWNSVAVFHHGRSEEGPARKAYGQALAAADRVLQAEPENGEGIDFKASTLHNLAALCEMYGRLEECETNYMQALRLWERMQAKAPDNVVLIEHLSQLYQSLAFLHGKRKDVAKAKECNAEALRLRERHLKIDPGNIRVLELLADIQQNIGEVHMQQNELSAAEACINRYSPIRETLAARDPANSQWQVKLADAWHNQATLETKRGNLRAALEKHRKSCELRERMLGKTPPGVAAEILQDWQRAMKEVEAELSRQGGRAGN